MTFDNLNLNTIEEFKNFNINSLISGEYDLSFGGVLDSFTEDDRFHCIYIVNGIPNINSLVPGIKVQKEIYLDIESGNPFSKINSKYNNSTYNIILNRNFNKPIMLANYYTLKSGFTPSNIKITLEGDLDIDLIETSNVSNDNISINNREFNLFNSILNYSKIDLDNGKFKQLYNYHVSIGSGGINAITINNRGLLNVNNWNVNLKDDEAECNIYGVIDLKGNMHHGTICKIKHLFKNTKSTQEFRHILNDNSYAMYDGTSSIDNKAKDSVALQQSKTIMLSNNARIYNKPRLNIFTGEVKAKHGASVGKLNDENIFYLRQRGLPENKIREILIRAYVDDYINKISSSVIKEYVYEKI